MIIFKTVQKLNAGSSFQLPLMFIVWLLAFIFSSCAGEEPVTEKISLPNIVLINADDLGYGDLGCYGATMVKTPHIDRLAEQGRLFTDAHAAAAVCSPSRYGLLTGRYPVRENFWGPITKETPLTIDTTQLTISRLLKEAGYKTACIGKWHLGFGSGPETDWNEPLKPGPLELGFDYFFGIPQVNSGPPFVYVENHQVVGYDPADPFVYGERSVTQEWPAKGWQAEFGGATNAHLNYRDEEIGTTLKDKAIEWMQQVHNSETNDPFFLYFATTNIHHPFTPAPQFLGTSECGLYGDFIHELDWMVGEILATIDDLGISDNTLVIFTSDNGGMLNHGGQEAWVAGHRLNGDLLGAKFGAWEGGHRIPFIARWPGDIPANGRSNQLLSHVDLLATFASIVEAPLGKDKKYDSVDQLEALTGNPASSLRDHLVISPNSPSHLVIRKGEWVYIDAQNEGGFQGKGIGEHTLGGAAALKLTGFANSDILDGNIRSGAPPAQLYDLSNDLSQTTNLYLERPIIVGDMKKILTSYREMARNFPELGWIDRR